MFVNSRSAQGRAARGMRAGVGIAVGAALVASLGACSSEPAESGPVTLTFQTWVPNIEPVVENFNEQHDDIQVEVEAITAGPDGGYAAMLSAVDAGNPADVAQVGYDQMASFLLRNALEDITEYVQDDVDVFSEWQLAANTFNDRIYGIPQASGPMGMFYRTDLFEQYGVAVPTTWEEYEQAARQIRAANPEAYIAVFAANQAPWIMGLAEQAGTPWFQAEGDEWAVDIANEDTLRMAEFWQRMIDEDLVKIENDLSSEWYADIQAGRVLSWMSGSWADAIIRGNAPDTAGLWGAAELPQWDAAEPRSASWGGGSSNVVLRGSDHPREAAEFALWLNSNVDSVSMLTEAGAGWPAISDVDSVPAIQDSPEVFEFFGGQDIWDVFAASNEQIALDWTWPPLTDSLYGFVTDEMRSAVESGTPLPQAFENIETRMVDEMEAAGLAVAR
ncbi:ABC transporter substrate-binding protein [Desertivibrio insolitus]|uniref:ABC transporter substrate-binding protein n=1 Tax=Herbiconiux sp. SYSU D00978 TaxID=2812562 RepID=UPI001A96D1D0|nr:extracellular solute-binding protein [Herbiconiux sp. SYSU D00978]